MTDLVPLDPASVVVHPLTGELVDIANAPDDELAQFLEGIDEAKARVQDAKSVVSQEVMRRMDRMNVRNMRAGVYGVTVNRPPEAATGYDGAGLLDDLLRLVDEDVLAIEAVNAAVQTEVSYKVDRHAVNRLKKLGGVVAEAVQRHVFEVNKPRYVTVKRVRRP